jgi:putative flippase GtrA
LETESRKRPNNLSLVAGQYVRFSIVGASSTAINWGLVYLLGWAFSVDMRPDFWPRNWILAFAFIVSAANGYVWNRVWTFRSSDSRVALQFGKFVVVVGVGLFLNAVIVNALLELDLRLIVCLIAATVVVSFWNFFVNRQWTFRVRAG